MVEVILVGSPCPVCHGQGIEHLVCDSCAGTGKLPPAVPRDPRKIALRNMMIFVVLVLALSVAVIIFT